MTEYLPGAAASPIVREAPLPVPARVTAAPDPVASPFEQGVDWRRCWGAVRRHRWWILGCAVLGTAGGVVGARMRPPRYQAQATIWIQAGEPRGPDRGPIGANRLLDASAWVDLLKSYVVLDDVVRDRQLYLGVVARDTRALTGFTVGDPVMPGRYRVVLDRSGSTFRLLGDDGVELQRGTVGDSIGQAVGFRWAPAAAVLPPGSEVTLIVSSVRDAAKRLGDELNVTIDPNGNFLRLSLSGTDGPTVAATLNAVAQRYVDAALKLKRAKLSELAALLAEQLQSARASLQRAESAYEAFRTRTITLPPDPGAAAAAAAGVQSPMSEFFGLRMAYDQMRRDQLAVAHVLTQAHDSAASIDALAAIGAVQQSLDLKQALSELTTKRAELRALRYRYTEDHPAVRRLATDIDVLQRQAIPGLARALHADLGARAQTLATEISAGGRELQAIPQRSIEEGRLRRDVSIAENLYASVQQRYNEARLGEASTVADVQVLDAAVSPQEAAKNTASRLVAFGFVVGLSLGMVAAVVVDRLDPRVHHPDQVTEQMGLSIIGVLPHVRDRRAGPDDQQVAHAIEAMRSIRLSLTHAHGAAGPMLVTISSPGVGDGKSFVSANLALAFAEAGRRTLLIDGDVRRGSLHRAVRARRQPGLTDFLAGRAPFEATVQGTPYPDLQFIGAGTRFRDSPELLGSGAMSELLARLRASWSVILVDSPPLGSGVDPYTLGTLTSNMLLVLRTDATDLSLARTKLSVLDHLPIRLLGVVVNDVRPGGVYRYYSYFAGYGTRDEGVAIATHRVRGVL